MGENSNVVERLFSARREIYESARHIKSMLTTIAEENLSNNNLEHMEYDQINRNGKLERKRKLNFSDIFDGYELCEPSMKKTPNLSDLSKKNS